MTSSGSSWKFAGVGWNLLTSRANRYMSCQSTTEWAGYQMSNRVQRDSLPSTAAGNGENVGIQYN